MHAKQALAAATATSNIFSQAYGQLVVNRPESHVSDMHGATVYVKLELHVGSRAVDLDALEELPADFLAVSASQKIKAALDVTDLRAITPDAIIGAVIEAIAEKLVALRRSVDLWIATELDQTHTDLDQLQDRIGEIDEPDDLPQLPVMIYARCGSFTSIFCEDPDNYFTTLGEVFSGTDMQSVIQAAKSVAVVQDSRSPKRKTGKTQGDQMMDFFFGN